MEYTLSRQTERNGEFYVYGTYDLSEPSEVQAFAEAVLAFGRGDARAVKAEPAKEI